MDVRWLNTWHIIYCTHAGFITWQVVAKNFLDLLFLFYLQHKKITSELLKGLAFFTHYQKCLSNKENSPEALHGLHHCSVSWLIHWFFFVLKNSLLVTEGKIACKDLWPHLDECVQESIYISNGNITFPFPGSTDCLWATINADTVKTSP